MARPWYQAAFGAHYPLLYAHRDDPEARQCLDLLPRLAPLHGATVNPILDLGCGDGRHLQWLTAAGETVVGLDLSPHLLTAAQGRTPAALVRGDMACLPFQSCAFDSVLSLFTAFGYFGDLPANASVVAGVSRVLKRGGHWFLDYFDCDRVTRELQGAPAAVRSREMGPLTVTETRRLRPDGRQVIKRVELAPRPGESEAAAAYGISQEGLTYEEQVAVFKLAEMDALALAHGLERVASAGGYGGEAVGQGSRWLMVFQRQDP